MPGRVPHGWQVEGTSPMVGIGGGAGEPGVVPMYAVDDIEVAVAAVAPPAGKPASSAEISCSRSQPVRPGGV